MAEGETPSYNIQMGRKYKKKFEREWEGQSLADMKTKTLQIQADRNISGICIGKFRRRYR